MFLICRKPVLFTALSLALLAAPMAARAQTATLSGVLYSFDVVNETGQDAHGFEIQLEGAVQNDLYYMMAGQQYGMPTVVPYATGVYIRWTSPYDSNTQQYGLRTPQHAPGTPYNWNDCYMLGSTYATAGCEALGQSLRPTNKVITATGHWLVDDPQSHGTLIAALPNVDIPLPYWAVAPAGTVGAAPVVVTEIEAPEPPETPEVYGNAQWTKVYKTQSTQEVTPDQLTSNNAAVVPQDPSQLEVAWEILQQSPPSNGKQTRNRHQAGIAADTRSIVRRIESYKYTGAYDAVTHKAVCADTVCAAPAASELGDFIAVVNTAVNVQPDALIVTKSGSGSVLGSNNRISCGNNCAVFALNGSALSLTASPGGNVFTGWSGACSGTQLTCTVTVNGPTQVGAAFLPQYTLSVGRSNSGTITSDLAGNDRAINCGSACSAKFTQGTTVRLTATPPAGKQLISWGGACSGSASSCTVLVTKNTSVQANFSK